MEHLSVAGKELNWEYYSDHFFGPTIETDHDYTKIKEYLDESIDETYDLEPRKYVTEVRWLGKIGVL